MAGRRRKSNEKHPGFYFWTKDWLGDEDLGEVDWAPKGLWADMVALSYTQTPRGVLPGDPEGLARIFGVKPRLRDPWYEDVKPLIQQLESAGVFSRGADVDLSLPPDSIVCRKAYRDWIEEMSVREARSKAGKLGAQARQAKSSKTSANWLAKGAANGHVDFSGTQALTQDSASKAVNKRSAKNTLTSSSPLPLRDNPAENERPQGSHARASRIDETLAAIFGGVPLIERIQAVAGDAAEWRPWWRSVVEHFAEGGCIGELEAAVQRVEDARDPRIRQAKDIGEFKQPGRWLSSQACRIARTRRVRIPNMPTGGRDA